MSNVWSAGVKNIVCGVLILFLFSLSKKKKPSWYKKKGERRNLIFKSIRSTLFDWFYSHWLLAAIQPVVASKKQPPWKDKPRGKDEYYYRWFTSTVYRTDSTTMLPGRLHYLLRTRRPIPTYSTTALAVVLLWCEGQRRNALSSIDP